MLLLRIQWIWFLWPLAILAVFVVGFGVLLARSAMVKVNDSLPVTNAYTQRLRLYRGEIGPGDVLTPADTSDVAIATLSYGVGNWYLVRGDTATARDWFARSVRSGGWPGFGFIISEIELQRLR